MHAHIVVARNRASARHDDTGARATTVSHVLKIAMATAMAVPIVGCTPQRGRDGDAPQASVAAARTTATPPHDYRDATWGFAIQSPTGWSVHHDFHTGYLANGAWKTFAGPHSQGTPILALVLPGSNDITSAEIRIGASRIASEVARCTSPPDAARHDGSHHQVVSGAGFTTFTAGDAAMSHYLDVHAYRTVHAGACYAIDLLVYGTNPQVYDPPATPPFTRSEAFTRMRRVLASFRFTGPGPHTGATVNTGATNP